MNTPRVSGQNEQRGVPLSSGEAMRQLHLESRKRPPSGAPLHEVPAPPRGKRLHERDPGEGGNDSLLPLPASTSRATYEALVQRVSVRSYDSRAVELDRVATILKAALCGDTREWPSEASALPLTIRLMAWRVEGLAPGVYTYVPESHALHHDGPAPDPAVDGPSLTLQLEFAEAPFLIFITGNLAASLARHSSRGYRLLLLRAGAAAHRAWIAAIGMGLGGVTFAGFLPTAASRYLGADGYQQCCLFAFAGGRPAPPRPNLQASRPSVLAGASA